MIIKPPTSGDVLYGVVWIAIALMMMVLALGCAEKVVYQSASGVVRLAEAVPAKIWVKDENGQWIRGANRVILGDGAYVTILPAVPALSLSKVSASNPPTTPTFQSSTQP